MLDSNQLSNFLCLNSCLTNELMTHYVKYLSKLNLDSWFEFRHANPPFIAEILRFLFLINFPWIYDRISIYICHTYTLKIISFFLFFFFLPNCTNLIFNTKCSTKFKPPIRWYGIYISALGYIYNMPLRLNLGLNCDILYH